MQTAMQCASKLEDFMPLSEDDFATLRTIENPYFLNQLTAMNTELLQKIEENKKKRSFMVRTLPEDVKDDALFEAIVDPFKGKVCSSGNPPRSIENRYSLQSEKRHHLRL